MSSAQPLDRSGSDHSRVSGKDDLLATIDEYGNAWLASPCAGHKINKLVVCCTATDRSLAVARELDGVEGYDSFYCSDAIVHKSKVFAVDATGGSVLSWDISRVHEQLEACRISRRFDCNQTTGCC